MNLDRFGPRLQKLAQFPGSLTRPVQRLLLISSIAAVLATLLGVTPASADRACGNGFTVGGRIEQEYVYLGGPAALGNCTTQELNADRNGKFQVFQDDGNGGKTAIYWNASVANGYAKMVRGEIYKRWTFYGWERGALGFPTISEATLATRGGKYNTFEGGSIYWSQNTGAHSVFGAIRDKWGAAGYETGTYGYPTTDEYELDGGIEQQFEGGTITYQPGLEPDADPDDTQPSFGGDDPRAVAVSRFSFNFPEPAGQCFTTNTPGEKICARIGDSTETNDGNVDARLRQAPSPQSPSSSQGPSTSSEEPSTPASPSAPESNLPSSSAPTSTTPTTTSTSPSVPSSPDTVAPGAAEESSPATAAQGALAVPSEAGKHRPSIRPALGDGTAPHFKLAAAPVPGLPGEPEPTDPDRDSVSERAFFTENGRLSCNPYLAKKLYASRFTSCGVFPYVYQIIQKNFVTNELSNAGWSKGFVYVKQSSTNQSLSTQLQTKTVQLKTAGNSSQASIQLKFSTDGGSISGNATQFGYLSSNPSFSVGVNQSGPLSQNQIKKMKPKIKINFVKEGFTEFTTNFNDFEVQPIRCDAMAYIPGQGCIMAPTFLGGAAGGRPVMDLGNQFFPGRAVNIYRDHILRSTNSGNPGNIQDLVLRPLTRIQYRSKQAAENRVRACAPARTRPYKPSPTSSWQCDEYPFASTAQGAASTPPNTGRTFSFCKFTGAYLDVYPDFKVIPGGYSACIIPKDQNQAGGGILPTFNRKNRLLFGNDRVDGDPEDGFFVYPYP